MKRFLSFLLIQLLVFTSANAGIRKRFDEHKLNFGKSASATRYLYFDKINDASSVNFNVDPALDELNIFTDVISFGKGAAENLRYTYDIGSGTGNPYIEWNDTEKSLKFSNDGVKANKIGAGAGDVNSLLSDGGFDLGAADTENGLDCAVGSCAQTTVAGEVLLGEGALEVTLSAESADTEMCFDNSSGVWDNRMIQIEGSIESSLASLEFCYTDKTTESKCILYDGSGKYRDFKLIEQVVDEDNVCWKIKSASETGTFRVDATSITKLKVDGTTKVITEDYKATDIQQYSTNNLAIPSFATITKDTTGDAVTVTNNGTDGFIVTANKKVSISMSFYGTYTTSGRWIGISKNASDSDLDSNIYLIPDVNIMAATRVEAISASQVASFSGILEPGDFVATHGQLALVFDTEDRYSGVTLTATHYEQKSVLSDASAEATFTKAENCTVTGTWLVNTTYSCLKTRVANKYEYEIGVETSGLPTATTLIINLPSGDVIDTAQILDTSAGLNGYRGEVWFLDGPGGSTDYVGRVAYETATSFRPMVKIANATFTTLGSVSDTQPFTFSTSDIIRMKFSLPIVGLEATPHIDGTFKPSVRNIKYSTNATQAIPSTAETRLDFEDLDYDEDSLVVTGVNWKYTVKETGKHSVNALACLSTYTPPAGTQVYLRLYKNNGASPVLQGKRVIAAATNNIWCASINAEEEFVEGDELYLTMYQNSGVNWVLLGSNETNYINIKREEQAGRLTQETPKKFQIKTMSGDLSSPSSGTITELSYTGLTIGGCYRISGRIHMETSGAGPTIDISIEDGTTPVDSLTWDADVSALAVAAFSINTIYKATATNLDFELATLTAGEIIRGNSTRSETWSSLEEVNCTETTQW